MSMRTTRGNSRRVSRDEPERPRHQVPTIEQVMEHNEALRDALDTVTDYLHRALRNVPRRERELLLEDLSDEDAIVTIGGLPRAG